MLRLQDWLNEAGLQCRPIFVGLLFFPGKNKGGAYWIWGKSTPKCTFSFRWNISRHRLCTFYSSFQLKQWLKSSGMFALWKRDRMKLRKGGQKVTLCYIGYTKQTNKQTAISYRMNFQIRLPPTIQQALLPRHLRSPGFLLMEGLHWQGWLVGM